MSNQVNFSRQDVAATSSSRPFYFKYGVYPKDVAINDGMWFTEYINKNQQKL